MRSGSSLQAALREERAAQGDGCKPPDVTRATLLHVHYSSVLPLNEFLVFCTTGRRAHRRDPDSGAMPVSPAPNPAIH